MSPRGARARRANGKKRAVWLAAGVVVLGGTGVTAVAVSGGGEDAGPGDGSRPAKAHVLALDGKDPKRRALPRTETQTFSLIGVSWEDSGDTFEGTAQIRTRKAATGEWSEWRDLDFDVRAPESAEGDASDVRGASEPLWVGPSDGVEARVVADGKETAVPDALRLDMIDPGKTVKGKGNGGDKGSGKGNGKGNGKPTASPDATPGPSDPAPTDAPTTAAPSADPGDTTGGSGGGEGSQPPTDEPTGSASAPEEPAPSTAPTESAPGTDPTEGTPDEPTGAPTGAPTDEPTGRPSAEPPTSEAPTDPTPSTVPTEEPTGPAPTTDPSGAPEPSATAPTAPAIVSRADWGADESLVQDPPAYLNKVDAVFVHHTAGTNDYTCADSPAIIRAILTFHVQTNGWNDIGYNFFVDKCGTVFEGRAGGVDRPVLGAHTYGFNSYSSGISLLGDYENGGTPTAAAKQAIADLAAWKLGLHGVDPEAKVTLTAAADTGVWTKGQAATLNTVSGHRDGYATLCPGASLYSALPGIRSAAGNSPYATGN
ncbi:N-acetylmuramoyl-L-alanine amidase (plasmid) [Streptomyces sp. NBC_00841]|uniref:peptidoglycan recognition protein family protein n=1 Tax=unclassified Streptomyces TaxID=2593676 RepID=UPI00225091D7|nr:MULTISPECIES: N-acetylmuramoyl-L-alanine amidase [unclassified Streptomyces]MCX4537945.1 N-acetylmuramoyl-L-alanine amidase [Streptomyces sp. NBC_01669]WSA05125.1 N-acetylmuramoyl-L-alanine amidase [Streptomyces sp. NBC_00841]